MKEKLLLLFFITCCLYSTCGKKFEDNNEDGRGPPPPDENKIHPIQPNERLKPPSCGVKRITCDPNYKFRNFDGSCNNLEHPEWGLPNSTYSRLLPAKYGDGIKSPRKANDQSSLPGARRIRTSLFPIKDVENTLWTINIMQWGQFMARDMSLLKEPDMEIPCCPKEGKFRNGPSKYCYPILIPDDDSTQGAAGIKCINFTRTVTDRDLGCTKKNLPANQINVVTPYLDLSNVYGNDLVEANNLRSFTRGQMKVEVRNNRIYPPTEVNKKVFCKCNSAQENTCYATGDSRSNQNPQLAILQILFVREHNRIANRLAELNPHWDDERLFQEARRINIAEYQWISYFEWMPILLDPSNVFNTGIVKFSPDGGFINDYNVKLRPDITNEFAHAAYRQFHTQIVGMLSLMTERRDRVGTTTMGEHINRPGVLEEGSFMQQFTAGMVTQPTGETDNYFDELVVDKLFACRNQGFGIDLKAADIQRDRDHGLAYYNDYRRLFGMNLSNSFDDFTSLHFTSDQVRQIRTWATVSRLFCDNADGITQMQPNGFILPRNDIYSGGVTLTPCEFIRPVDLSLWKEY